MNNIAIIIVTLLFSAFFSGMEIAFVSSSNLKIELDRSKGLLSGRILSRFNQHPSRFIGALLLGNNVSLVIYGIAMSDLLFPWIVGFLPPYLMSEIMILIIQTIIATFVILLTAEFLPKMLFIQRPNAVLNLFAIPAYIFYYLFFPFIWIFIGIAGWVLRIVFGIRSLKQSYVFTPIDLDDYLKKFSGESKEEDAVTQEIQMVQNAIDFTNVKLRACMVPRPEIIAPLTTSGKSSLKPDFQKYSSTKKA
jgi:CBS domain containing-hemolysin-like protein